MLKDPTIKTINHEKINIIIVRIAVATFESTFLIPILAKIAVNPANNAAPNANNIHIKSSSLLPNLYNIILNNYTASSYLYI